MSESILSDLNLSELILSLKGLNLYLIGMMGSGKSTTGRLLAEQLGYHFFDTDAVIVQATGQTIPQLFAEGGEPAFRAIETQVLGQLAAHTRLVVATGGGIVLDRMNWSHLRQGLVVWLEVPPEDLWHRIKGDTSRPLLQKPDPQQTLNQLLTQRQALYAQADVRVTVQSEDTPDLVAQRVLIKIPQVISPQVSSSQVSSSSMLDSNAIADD